MNTPNLLTLSRVVLSGFFVYFLFLPESWGKMAALGVFVLAAATDYWDGYFARKQGLVSLFGKLADPIADKVLTLSAFISFYFLELAAPLWVVLITIREVYVTYLRLFVPNQVAVAAQRSGKNKTFLQMTYIISTLLYLSVNEAGLLTVERSILIEQVLHFVLIMVVLITLWSGFRLADKHKLTPSA